MLRQPIITIMGNVDAGKTSLLDFIRKTSVAKSEPGLITQSISSTNLPIKTITDMCKDLMKGKEIKIPGFLFIDTPGHAAFKNMRKRGGNLADIAILVIDINDLVKEQTVECIQILKQYKTPFVIALNKIDALSGWRSNKTSLLQNIKNQSEHVANELDKRIYTLVGKLSEFGFNSERFDRVDDFTKQVAIVPASAKTGEGIPELLMVLLGLSQKYLEKTLQIEVKGPGKATVLEVNENKKLGISLDVILHDGTLKVNDVIAIGTLADPIITKVRSLFILEKNKLKTIKDVSAAIGVKLIATDIKHVIGGMPLRVANENLEKIKEEIKKEIEEVILEIDKEGIIVKADTLGSLEALINLLRQKGIKIKKASIGDVTKKDIAEALTEKENVNKVILCFNAKSEIESDVKVISNNVIYRLIEDLEKWVSEEKKKEEREALEKIRRPFKIKILRGCVFRQSNPAVVGVAVLNGVLKTDCNLIKADGSKASHIKGMQLDAKDIKEAERGKEVAISIPGIIVGRQIKEDDILYSDLTAEEFEKLKEFKKFLKDDEIEALKEIAKIKRREDPMWGV